MSGEKKKQNNADINSFVSTHHPRPVVYAELYFLYFIFLTEFSSTAVCVTPARASMAVEKSTADFYTAFQLDTVLLSRKRWSRSRDINDSPSGSCSVLVCVGRGDVVLCYKRLDSHTIYCYNPSAHIIMM